MKKLWEEIKYKALLIGVKNLNATSNISMHLIFWVGWLLFVIIASTTSYFLWGWISDFYGLSKEPMQGQEHHSQIVRNLGWLVWMAISFFGVSIGLWVAIWGRIIQQRSHLHERYEKAASMLGNEVMAVRIAGCRALMSLGVDDESMKAQCVRLLFAFINYPHLKPDEQDKKLDEIFSKDKPLRADIQSAANSFSAIYNHYGNEGIDDERVQLPSYFWKNKCKDFIYLIKANLIGEDLQEANLRGVNLQGANLRDAKLQGANLRDAKLQGANLRRANLQNATLAFARLQVVNLREAKLQGSHLNLARFFGADLSLADLRKANIIKEQILSARWGVIVGIEDSVPLLPEKLATDSDVQEWLANPHYKIEEEAEEKTEAELAKELLADLEKEEARAEARAEEAAAIFAEALRKRIAKREKEEMEDRIAEEEWKRNR